MEPDKYEGNRIEQTLENKSCLSIGVDPRNDQNGLKSFKLIDCVFTVVIRWKLCKLVEYDQAAIAWFTSLRVYDGSFYMFFLSIDIFVDNLLQ